MRMVKFDFKDYENIPYFTLVDMAEKERDLEKRAALFEFSDKILERVFLKFSKPEEKTSQ